jgi:hypothetical protein
MEEENNNRTYTAGDIRKYFDGKLSDPEMQAMEKAALEDPFLADAMEGYEESRKHPVSFESGMEDLQQRLSARIHQRNRKKKILFQMSAWQAAASLLFLIGSAVFILTYINNKTHSAQIAVSTNKDSSLVKNTPATPIQKSDSSQKTEHKDIISDKPMTTTDRAIVSGKKEKPAAIHEIQVEKVPPEAPPAASPTADLADTVSRSRKSDGFYKEDLRSQNEISAAASTKEKINEPVLRSLSKLPGDYVKGVVINDMGKPIPHADIFVRGFSRHIYTDTAGFFKLYMKNPRLAALIFIQPAGYDPVSAELKPDSNITHTIQLQSSSPAMAEVVALDYKKQSDIDGWDAFSNYINNNKKINSADSAIKGEEVISFLLHRDGRLSSFKFDHSLSPAHDSTIVQLIRTAPPLKLENVKKRRCTIRIIFK